MLLKVIYFATDKGKSSMCGVFIEIEIILVRVNVESRII